MTARDSGDRKFGDRTKTKGTILGTTTTHTTASEDEDGYKNVTGSTTKTKGGTSTKTGLTPKEEKKGASPYDEEFFEN